MLMRRTLIILIFLIISCSVQSQTLGGNSVYNFLRLSASPQLSGLGGMNVSSIGNDITMTSNPAMLRSSMHTQAGAVFTSFYSSIKMYHLTAAYHLPNAETTFGLGVTYFDYGDIVETDESGNVFGEFRPRDYYIQLFASRKYKEHWHYGASLKLIQSQYGRFKSTGVAMDIGLTYFDSSKGIQAGLVFKNMGTQLKAYNGTGKDDLPFDIQLGISKKLAKAPLQFSLTSHHLHTFNIRYDDTAFNEVNSNEKKFTFDKLFRHLVLSTQLYIADKVELSLGYNYLRRKELNVGSSGNGLNGFSASVGVVLKNLQIRYGRSYYQNNTAYNQFGLNIRLNDYIGSTKTANRNQ